MSAREMHRKPRARPRKRPPAPAAPAVPSPEPRRAMIADAEYGERTIERDIERALGPEDETPTRCG